jgi:predicted ester cyclase
MADNSEIVRRLAEEYWTNPDIADELVSPDYIGHDPALPEPIRGPQGVRENFDRYREGFEGATIKVIDAIAEGDLVSVRWEGRGRHTGEIMGFGPTGKDVVVTGQTFARVRDGKIVEDWTNWDTLGMLQQIGAIPTGAAAQTT